jgi:hypothetical protein
MHSRYGKHTQLVNQKLMKNNIVSQTQSGFFTKKDLRNRHSLVIRQVKIFKPEWPNWLCLLCHLCSWVMIFRGFILCTYISYGLSLLYIVSISVCFTRDTFPFVAMMESLGLTNPVLRIHKSDDCVSLGIDHYGSRCTNKQDQLVSQPKRQKKKKHSLIFKNSIITSSYLVIEESHNSKEM